MQKISGAEIASLSKAFEIHDVNLTRAFILVESSGSGFDSKTGKLKIQFEPKRFQHYTGILIENGVEGQLAEYKAFDKAYLINPHFALMSTSMGMMQIMGDEFEKAGYRSVEEMWNDFKISEYYHVRAGMNFICNKKGLRQALVSKNFPKVGWLYNGEDYLTAKARYVEKKAKGEKCNPPYADQMVITYNKLSFKL